jgi:hypothetical protein
MPPFGLPSLLSDVKDRLRSELSSGCGSALSVPNTKIANRPLEFLKNAIRPVHLSTENRKLGGVVNVCDTKKQKCQVRLVVVA